MDKCVCVCENTFSLSSVNSSIVKKLKRKIMLVVLEVAALIAVIVLPLVPQKKAVK